MLLGQKIKELRMECYKDNWPPSSKLTPQCFQKSKEVIDVQNAHKLFK